MKFLVIVIALIVATSASPERQRRSIGWGPWGHNGAVILGGVGVVPHVAPAAAIVGPISPSVAVVGPAAGSAAVVGPVASHAAVVGPVAPHAAVIGGVHGATVVAGPAGVISAGGLWH